MKYWIMDRDETPQGLPLQRLIRRIRRVLGGSIGKCSLTRAEGYGQQIFEWDQALDEQEAIFVDIDQLQELSAGTKEWFFNLDVSFDSYGVRFGLHDSTALYVDGPERVAKAVVDEFESIRSAT